MLVIQQQKLHELLYGIKYLVLVSNLVIKTNYNTKVTEIGKKLTDHNHDKYITTPEFITLAADVLNARLAQANLSFDFKNRL